MAGIDERIVKVTIEVEDKFFTYENLYIKAIGSKYASATQNETTFNIGNINKEERDFLLTAGSPFNRIKNRKRNKIIIEVGRVSTGTFELFVGDITTVNMTQPPDIFLEIKAITSQFLKGNIIARTQPGMASFKTIAQQIADDLGLSLVFEAQDKQIANYAYSGSSIKQIDRLDEMAPGVDAYIDDNKLVVKRSASPITGRSRPVDIDNGLIGIPVFIDFGIKVTMLIDNETRIGDEIVVKSLVYPSSNGSYVIYRMDFDVANRDNPFYYIVEARRLQVN